MYVTSNHLRTYKYKQCFPKTDINCSIYLFYIHYHRKFIVNLSMIINLLLFKFFFMNHLPTVQETLLVK